MAVIVVVQTVDIMAHGSTMMSLLKEVVLNLKRMFYIEEIGILSLWECFPGEFGMSGGR